MKITNNEAKETREESITTNEPMISASSTNSPFFNYIQPSILPFLPHILSVGSLAGYSVVAAYVMTLRWNDSQVSKRMEDIFLILLIAIAIFAAAGLQFRQVYRDPPGFSCPRVPIVPAVCIFFNIFLFAQEQFTMLFQDPCFIDQLKIFNRWQKRQSSSDEDDDEEGTEDED